MPGLQINVRNSIRRCKTRAYSTVIDVRRAMDGRLYEAVVVSTQSSVITHQMAALLRENMQKFRESQLPAPVMSLSEIEAFVDEAYANAEKASKLGACKLLLSYSLGEKRWVGYNDHYVAVYWNKYTMKNIPASVSNVVAKVANDKYGIEAWHLLAWTFSW